MQLARIAAWGVLAGFLVIGAALFIFREAPQDPSIARERAVRRVTVELEPKSVRSNTSTLLKVTARDEEGDATAVWENGTSKAWLVRSDLTYVTRPEIRATDAVSSIPVTVFPTEPGSYRIVIENRHEDVVMVGAAALTVTGPSGDVPPAEQSAGREGFKVIASTIPEAAAIRAEAPISVTYRVTRTGTPVPLDTDVDGRGQLVAFHDGAGLFVHAEPLDVSLLPSDSTSAFTMIFPQQGRYRLFFEFSVGGKRYTDARWIEVGAKAP